MVTMLRNRLHFSRQPRSSAWLVRAFGFVLRRLALLAALAAGLLGAAGLAQAQVPTPYITINNPSGPITGIFLGNDLSLQVAYQGFPNYQVYPSSTRPGDYGTLVAIDDVLYTPYFKNHGAATANNGNTATGFAVGDSNLTMLTPAGQTAVTGTGTRADPYTVTTKANAGTTGIQITDTVTYVVGDEFLHTSTTLTNSGATARAVRLYRVMDCYLGTSDNGYGIAATGLIACAKNENNSPAGLIEGFTFTPGPGVHYMEDLYSTVWNQPRHRDAFPDTVNPNGLDNGIGVSWELTVPAGGSVTVAGNTLFLPTGVWPLDTQISANPSSVTAGGQVTYTVTVSNANSSAVTLESLTNVLPGGFSYVSGSAGGDLAGQNPVITGQTLEWAGTGVTVPANGDVVFTFIAGVAATTSAGSYTTTVDGTAVDPTYAVVPDRDDAIVTVGAHAPLETQISANPGSVTAGGQVTYTVTVTNPNASAVPLESLTNVLPSGFSYHGNSAGGEFAGENPTITGQTLEWAGSGVTVPANGDIVFTFVADVAPTTSGGSHTATVDGTATDPAYAVTPGQADAIVTAAAVVPLETRISAKPGSVTPGGQVTYTVTVTNANSSAVPLSSLTNDLPSGFSYVHGSAEGDLAGQDPAITGQTLEWGGSGLTVPANGEFVFTFVADVASTVPAGSYTAGVNGTATNPAYAVTPDQHDALVAVGSIQPQSSTPIPSLNELALALLALLLAAGAALEMRRRSR